MRTLCSDSQGVFTAEYISSDSDGESPIEVDATKDIQYVCVYYIVNLS